MVALITARLGSGLAHFVKENSINPAIGYEVSCEIEMNMIELCQSKGIDSSELEIHRHIAEMNWKARKESIVNEGDQENNK
jgi:hypothetical protein